MARRKTDLLTEVELEFMKALWEIGRGTVRDVYRALESDKPRAYTSVATVLKVLESKGYVTSGKEDRTLVYRAIVARDAYESRSLREISKSLFGGTPQAMVARLVEDEELTDDMIREIRAIIDERIARDGS